MGEMHYNKCKCIDTIGFYKYRKGGGAFICLKVAGAKFLVMVCPECYKSLKKWGTVGVIFYTKKRVTREVKRYPGDQNQPFFEILVS